MKIERHAREIEVSRYNRNNSNVFKDTVSPACQSLALINSFSNRRLIQAFGQPNSLLYILNTNDTSVKLVLEVSRDVMRAGAVLVKL